MKAYTDGSRRSMRCSLVGCFFTFGFITFLLLLFLVARHVYFWNHIAHSTTPVNWFLFTVLAGSIGGSNAEEVAPSEVEGDTNEQAPDHECFLGLHGVSNNISSCEDNVIFVEPLEVDEIPDSKKGE